MKKKNLQLEEKVREGNSFSICREWKDLKWLFGGKRGLECQSWSG